MNILIALAFMLIGLICIERFQHKRDRSLILKQPIDHTDLYWAIVFLVLSFAIFAITLFNRH